MPRNLTTQTPAAPALDELFVCADCYSWLINGDATGLDYSRDEDEAAERLAAIQEGERTLLEDYESLHMGAAMYDEEFSPAPCDCCGTRLAGSRHHMHAWQRRVTTGTPHQVGPGRWEHCGWDIARQGDVYVAWRLPNFRRTATTLEGAARIAERRPYIA